MEENKVKKEETVSEALDKAMNGFDQTIVIDDTTVYTADCDDTVYAIGDAVPVTSVTEEDKHTAVEEDIDDDKIIIEYTSGVSLSMSYPDMDWESIWQNAAPDMMNNLSVLKHMYNELLSETDETKREELATNAITTVKEFFQSVGVPEIDYGGLRSDIPIVEEAYSVLTDGIILLYELIHHSEVYILTAKTNDMTLDDLAEQWSNMIAGGNTFNR